MAYNTSKPFSWRSLRLWFLCLLFLQTPRANDREGCLPIGKKALPRAIPKGVWFGEYKANALK